MLFTTFTAATLIGDDFTDAGHLIAFTIGVAGARLVTQTLSRHVVTPAAFPAQRPAPAAQQPALTRSRD